MHQDVIPTGERSDGMPRRTFLQTSAAVAGAGFAALLTGTRAAAQAEKKTKLAYVKHASATDERGVGQADIVKQMVDRAVRELTGKDAIGDAWRQLVSPDDVVGLKVNLRGGRNLSTQPCVVDAITAGLQAAGVKANNIIVWDAWTSEMAPAGYTVNVSSEGVRYFATDHGASNVDTSEEGPKEAVKPFYTSEATPVADKTAQFSRILANAITALINVPLIKDHMIAGVTCSMKNHFGSILTPRDLHGNACDPYLGELNACAPIKGKTRLILVDGLRALYNGGPRDKPQWRWRQNCVIAGTDTVAVDALALKIIDDKRKEKDMPPVAGRAHYLAAAAKIGLGTDDLSRVDLREIDLSAGA